MSAQPYEPLHVVPPLSGQKMQLAWLLHARRAARRALDAALAVPSRAAWYLSRLVHTLHLNRAVSWLGGAAARLLTPMSKLAGSLGRTGVLAAAAALASSPTGRAVVNSVGRTLGTLGGWMARKVYTGLDRALRCFGKAGNKVADKLCSGIVSLGGKIATVAGPVVHRVAHLCAPHTTQARLVSGICQSYLIHKLVQGLLGNTWLRLLVQAVLLPAVLDSRLVAWTRTTLRQARTRAHRLQEQAQVLVDLEQQQAEDHPRLFPGDLEDVHVVTTLDEPVPANRAERRAAQRHGARPQH